MDMGENHYSLEQIRAMNMKGAAYIRMSTDMQVDSPAIQEAKIREFAAKYNIEIVKLYIDKGISGMTAEGRPQFRALLRDVKEGRYNFHIVLYLDESRWGRFVNSRDAEFYRTQLERKNVLCRPCDKELTLSSSLGDRITTIVHDEAASHYSRQLSGKVLSGQTAKSRQGYRQGGPAGYGLRRMLLNENGEPKQILAQGERKSLQTERVILVPGPDEEIRTVNWIYDKFIEGKSLAHIAKTLNDTGCMNDWGRPWSHGTIKEILTNEKYIGNNLFNRVSRKMKTKPHPNPESEWVRKDGAFTPIVTKERFELVQRIFHDTWDKVSDEEILATISRLHKQKGVLSIVIIEEADDLPPYSHLLKRFGGVSRIYKLINYTPKRSLDFLEVNRHLRQLHKDVLDDTVARIAETCGREIYVDPKTSLLHINFFMTVSIVICRCHTRGSGARCWKIRFDTKLRPDITVAVRMDPQNKHIQDYYVLPKYLYTTDFLDLSDDNDWLLDTFRTNSLDPFFRLSVNIPLSEAVQYAKRYRTIHCH